MWHGLPHNAVAEFQDWMFRERGGVCDDLCDPAQEVTQHPFHILFLMVILSLHSGSSGEERDSTSWQKWRVSEGHVGKLARMHGLHLANAQSSLWHHLLHLQDTSAGRQMWGCPKRDQRHPGLPQDPQIKIGDNISYTPLPTYSISTGRFNLDALENLAWKQYCYLRVHVQCPCPNKGRWDTAVYLQAGTSFPACWLLKHCGDFPFVMC